MTADTFRADEVRFALCVKLNRLMTAIHTGYMTTSAAYTALAIEFREDYCLAIEIVGQQHIVQFFANEILQFSYSAA
jgi:hypothetical protein